MTGTLLKTDQDYRSSKKDRKRDPGQQTRSLIRPREGPRSSRAYTGFDTLGLLLYLPRSSVYKTLSKSSMEGHYGGATEGHRRTVDRGTFEGFLFFPKSIILSQNETFYDGRASEVKRESDVRGS